MKTRFFSFHALIGMVVSAEKFMGGKDFVPMNELQRKLKDEIYPRVRGEMELPEVRCKAGTVPDVNEFLRKEGFTIELPPNDWATAGIIKMLVEWVNPGEPEDIYCGRKTYPGVRMNAKEENEEEGTSSQNFDVFNVPEHSHPVLRLRTKNKARHVCLTRFDGDFSSDWEVFEAVQRIRTANKEVDGEYTSALFPMADVSSKPDVGYLSGMRFGESTLENALAEATFKMNERGALAEVAVGGACSFCGEEKVLMIEGPFLVWFEGEGCDLPLAFGHICEDSFAKPKIEF